MGIKWVEQVRRGDVQRHGKTQQVEQGDIPFAAFDLANVIHVEAGALGEVFLFQALAFPERADGCSKERARNVLAGTIDTGRFRRCQAVPRVLRRPRSVWRRRM